MFRIEANRNNILKFASKYLKQQPISISSTDFADKICGYSKDSFIRKTTELYEDKQNQPRVLIVNTVNFANGMRLFNVYFNSVYDDGVPNNEDIDFVVNKLTDNLYNNTIMFTDCYELISNKTIRDNWILVDKDYPLLSQMIDFRYVDHSLINAHADRSIIFIESKSNIINPPCIIS